VGRLYGPIKGFTKGADVSASILVSGAFLAIINYVGTMDAGVGALLKRYNGKKLLAILMLMFALMSTVYGAWEEFPAYALVLIPLCIKAGYDVLTGFYVLFVAAVVGNMASVVNPYSTGVAVSAINPELSLGTGILMRVVLFIVLYAVGTVLVIRYAEKVKKDPTSSVVYGMDVNDLMTDHNEKELPELTARRKWSLAVFAIMVLIIIIGYILVCHPLRRPDHVRGGQLPPDLAERAHPRPGRPAGREQLHLVGRLVL